MKQNRKKKNADKNELNFPNNGKIKSNSYLCLFSPSCFTDSILPIEVKAVS